VTAPDPPDISGPQDERPGTSPAEPPPQTSDSGNAAASPVSSPPPAGDHAEYPADIRTPLGWFDLLYLALFYLIAGLLLSLAVAAIGIFAFGASPAILRKPGGPQATVLIVSQALLSVATMLFLYVLVRARSSAPFWPAVGWRAFHNVASGVTTAVRYALGGFALALIVGLISRFFGKTPVLPIEEMFRNRQSVLMLTALGILVAPAVEETVFRGCIYPVIARRFGIRTGVLVTGTLFGLAHAQQLWGGWGQIALLICVGIVLTHVRARKGTVFASYFVHLGYNTILFAGFYFATSGLRHFPPT
jgi:membrane protease YdiL (CAAX protease family)